MKKYFFFLLILCAADCYSQKFPMIFSSIDGMVVYPVKNTEINVPSYSLINGYTSFVFGKKVQYGLFIEANYEPTAFIIAEPKVFSILPGALIAGRSNNNIYFELGVGPGFQTRKDNISTQQITYIHQYGYIETKSDEVRAKHKLVLSENYSALPEKYGKWYVAYAIYYPFNESFGVGVHAQSYGTWGARIQYLFKGDSPRKILWVAGWNHDFTVGISLAKQWRGQRVH